VAHGKSPQASIVPYRSFKTSDGDILFGAGNDRLFRSLCQGLGHPEWVTASQYATNALRVQHRDALEAAIEAVTVKKTTAEWLAVFTGSGLPYAAVNDVLDTLNHAQVRARDMVVQVQHPFCGTISLLNPPVKYSACRPRVRTPPPLLGEHTHEILRDVVGLSEVEIERLREEGAVK
jgi:succinate---hydroxymethylglutarate CoA-transferase